MTTDTPKTDELYAKIWLPINEEQVDEALGTLRDHAQQMERDAREYKDELARVLARETELNIQARRDAERADANAAEVGRLRAALDGVLPIFRGKFLHAEEHQKIATAHDALSNNQVTGAAQPRSV